jgi:predicted nucleic acid-binding protein
MTHLDTSALVDSLTGSKRSGRALRALVEQGERLGISAIVLYEWRRGPRQPEEIRVQEALLPSGEAVAFGTVEAAKAAELYRQLPRARGREIDLAIAACAIVHDAALWTLNPADFRDVPGLRLA